MEKIHFEIFIEAPREHVWNTMLDDVTYRKWTEAFHPCSYYKGSWDQGSEIYFLGPDQDGSTESGMVAQIRENRKYEFISIEHLGFIQAGKEDRTSEEVKKWVPAFENYTFESVGLGTKLSIDVDVNQAYKAMFQEMWPKALAVLKQLSENN